MLPKTTITKQIRIVMVYLWCLYRQIFYENKIKNRACGACATKFWNIWCNLHNCTTINKRVTSVQPVGSAVQQKNQYAILWWTYVAKHKGGPKSKILRAAPGHTLAQSNALLISSLTGLDQEISASSHLAVRSKKGYNVLYMWSPHMRQFFRVPTFYL